MTLFLPDLDAPLYDDCLHCSITDTAGVLCGAIYGDFEKTDIDGSTAKHRYVLYRVWDAEKPPLVNIGLNPSTATHLVLDPTLRRDIRFARDWGYGGLVKLNLFSYRSTDPQALHEWVTAHGGVNPAPLTGGRKNDDYIAYFASRERAALILCAWGNHGALLNRGFYMFSSLAFAGMPLHVLALTKTGQPLHTLYARADLIPLLWTA